MAERVLTAANSVIMLTIVGLYDTPQQLQGYATDNIFENEGVTPAEIQMGIDGKLSAGWVPTPNIFRITLMANSASNDLFENWVSAQDSVQDMYIANGLVTLPATGRKYTMTRGFLSTVQKIPSAGRVLSPRTYGITFEKIQGAAATI